MSDPTPSRKIIPVSRLIEPIDRAEVARAAAHLGTRFPEGYEVFITTYGAGDLANWVRIDTPAEVLKTTDWHRDFLREQRTRGEWFWDRDGVLSPQQAAEAVVLGSSTGGDTLVFHPDDPDVIYVLPRHGEVIHRIGRGLEEALDWLFLSGKLTSPIAVRAFEPDAEREQQGWSIDLDFDEVRSTLLDQGLHDIVIHDDHDDETGDRILELYVVEFSGTVSVLNGGDDDECDVTVERDPGPSTPKLERLVALLDAM